VTSRAPFAAAIAAALLVLACAQAAWGANGAIVSSRDNNLWIQDARGARQLTHDTGASQGGARFSPDGTRIAWTRYTVGDIRGMRASYPHIFVMRSDGSGMRQITSSGAESDPDWSPDGLYLGWHAELSGFPQNGLVIAQADGSGQRLVDHPPRETVSGPRWSPRGNAVLGTSWTNTEADPTNQGLDLVDATSGTRRTLRAGLIGGFTWSPDATRIAFTTVTNAGESVWVMNADGSGAHAVRGFAAGPVWSPDGTSILFEDRRCQGSFTDPASGLEFDLDKSVAPGCAWMMRPDGGGAAEIAVHGVATGWARCSSGCHPLGPQPGLRLSMRKSSDRGGGYQLRVTIRRRGRTTPVRGVRIGTAVGVSPDSPSGGSGPATRTGRRGTATLPSLARGRWVITAVRPGYTSVIRMFTVR
jgi:hypothetical protein